MEMGAIGSNGHLAERQLLEKMAGSVPYSCIFFVPSTSPMFSSVTFLPVCVLASCRHP